MPNPELLLFKTAQLLAEPLGGADALPLSGLSVAFNRFFNDLRSFVEQSVDLVILSKRWYGRVERLQLFAERRRVLYKRFEFFVADFRGFLQDPLQNLASLFFSHS